MASVDQVISDMSSDDDAKRPMTVDSEDVQRAVENH